MKTFRRGTVAQEVAGCQPYLKIQCGSESLYVVFDGADLLDIQLAEVALVALSPTVTPTIVGHVTLGHLDRLENANWATTQHKTGINLSRNWSAFGDRGPKVQARRQSDVAQRLLLEQEKARKRAFEFEMEVSD